LHTPSAPQLVIALGISQREPHWPQFTSESSRASQPSLASPLQSP